MMAEGKSVAASEATQDVKGGVESNVRVLVSHVTKMYRLFDRPVDLLKHQLFGKFGKDYGKEFWALRDVSFEVGRGESFGVIGRNGAGKSTLLQIIAGTLRPTAGEARVNGKAAALLELGSGFNPEFTGRSNVYINASILGLTQKETDVKFDEIEAFAEIGSFIDRPVKTYSSGMMVRLAFAVQTVLEPDILIVDEVLSVGDFFFAQRCAARMRELRERGTTLLFVSHDMSVVRDLCERAVYLRQGQAVYVGDSKRAISLYFQEGQSVGSNKSCERSITTPGEPSADAVAHFFQKACWVSQSSATSDETDAKVLAVAVLDAQGEPTMKVRMGDELIIRMLFRTQRDCACGISLAIKNRFDQVVSSFGTYTCGVEPHFFSRGETGLFEFRIRCMLEAGLYSFNVNLSSDGPLPNRGRLIDESPWLGPFKIDWAYENERAPFLGMFGLPVRAKYIIETDGDG
jgi:lipopolysaccharide transport system ATP-binding protein